MEVLEVKPYVLPQKCISVNFVVTEWLTHADLVYIIRQVCTDSYVVIWRHYVSHLCKRDGHSPLPFVIITIIFSVSFYYKKVNTISFLYQYPFFYAIHVMPLHNIFKVNFHLIWLTPIG